MESERPSRRCPYHAVAVGSSTRSYNTVSQRARGRALCEQKKETAAGISSEGPRDLETNVGMRLLAFAKLPCGKSSVTRSARARARLCPFPPTEGLLAVTCVPRNAGNVMCQHTHDAFGLPNAGSNGDTCTCTPRAYRVLSNPLTFRRAHGVNFIDR